LNLEEKVEMVVVPFCGMIREDKCYGLKLNHGLYTQCMNSYNDEDLHLCKTCTNQSKKNESGKPTYGVIQDRMEGNALDFRDPKGKLVVPYGNVMEKLKISKEQAISAANKLDLTIPEEQFAVKKAKRGRPKKDTSISDTKSEKSVASEPKKRGRPKKDKQIVSSMEPGDDLIAALVAKAKIEEEPKAEKKAEPKAEKKAEPNAEKKAEPTPPEEDEEEEEEEEIEVKRFKHKGVEYLKAGDNVLYNMDSEVVGIWNELTNEIDPAPDDDDDDDE